MPGERMTTEAMIKRYLDGETYEAIGAVAGVSKQAVEQRLRPARECGLIPAGRTSGLSQRAAELAALLREPHTYPRPSTWKGGRPWGHRDVYEADAGGWFLTYSADLDYNEFDLADVLLLERRGLVEPTWPEHRGCFSPTNKLLTPSNG